MHVIIRPGMWGFRSAVPNWLQGNRMAICEDDRCGCASWKPQVGCYGC